MKPKDLDEVKKEISRVYDEIIINRKEINKLKDEKTGMAKKTRKSKTKTT